MNYDTMIEMIKARKAELGISHMKLSSRMGVSHACIHNWLTLKHIPRLINFETLLEVLKLSMILDGAYCDAEDIREAVRNTVKDRNMTNYRLMKIADASQESIRCWLNGERGIEMNTLIKIINALGMNLCIAEMEVQ